MLKHGRAASCTAMYSQASLDDLERAGDRVAALCAAFDHLDVHESHVGPIAALEELAVLGGDRHDDLRDVVAIDERLDGTQPDRTPFQLGVDLLLLRVAESGRPSRGRQYDGELSHGERSSSSPGR